MNGLSRRDFLKVLGVSAGALAGARLGTARAATTEPTTIVMLHLVGGMNAMFGSAETLQGKFGITGTNFAKLGPVSIDNSFAATMPDFAKQHVAAIGVRHGISAHPAARNALFANDKGACTPMVLASAMGGGGSIKACILGTALTAEKVSTAAVNGVSLQRINDMQSVIDSLGAGTDREGALAGLKTAQKLSGAELGRKAPALTSLGDGYGAIVDTLARPGATFDFKTLSTAYGLGAKTAIASPSSKFAAAELMTRAGANVVVIQDRSWDTHKDITGNAVRTQFDKEIKAPLNTFLDRMLNLADRNVVVAMFGDFARSLPGSDHQPNLTALVFGKYVKRGSTGATDAKVSLPPGTASVPGYWAYVAAAAKIDGAPFGQNPHGLIL
jgi:hypothetical protein